MSEKISEEEIENYREAGEILSEVMEEAKEMIEPEAKLLDIAEKVEEMIEEKDAKPAFPCNISINENAAHYTPPDEDDAVIEDGDLVTIDIGVHVKGYIADMATTIYAKEEPEEPEEPEETEGEEEAEAEAEEEEEQEEPDAEESDEQESDEQESEEPEEEEDEEDELAKKKEDMVETIHTVLEKAIDAVEPGVNIGEIGRIIEETAEENGYKPISNLTGHNLERFSLHSGISIPNVEEDSEIELEEGEVVALEPFITDGEGEVDESQEVYIFRALEGGSVSGRMAQQTLRKIRRNYKGLPFAERWLTEDLSRIRLQMTLRELIASEALKPYYVLKEVEDGLVAQAEHTMIVTEDGCEVTTR